MNDLLHMLFGAALVVIGVLSSALADRIRGIRARERRENAQRERAQISPANGAGASNAMAKDVIAALAQAGYTKAVANEAVWSCLGSERATIESWTRAALRRCMRDGKEGRS